MRTIAKPFVLALLLTLSFGGLLSVFAATPVMPGDLAPLNAPDGSLNIADVLILNQFVNGDLSPTTEQLIAADVAPLNQPDGQLNAGDLVVLQRAVLGKITLSSGATFIPTGSSWTYLDNGSNQGTAWRAAGFNDGGWSSGAAQLGYGDGDETTVVSFGPDAANKYITTYFRRSFTVADASLVTALTLNLLRDDGAVVYLNGTEVVRSNIPGGTITSTTLAATAIGPPEESSIYTFSVDPTLLVSGANVMAVEVHQGSLGSSDLSFDLELTGTANPNTGVPPATPVLDPPGSPTTDNPIVVSGQADAGSTVQVYANATVVASGTAGADGSFSVAAPLNEGFNVIQVSAIANGAESPLSGTQSVVLDSAAPVVNTTLVVTSLGGGLIRVTGSTEAGSAIQIDAADGQTVPGSADASGNFAIVLNGQPGDGLSVRATDTAGNVSVSLNTTVVGATAGQFEVDDSGGANYTIPLQVPPGTAGMQPDLSLTFNSRTGNGLLGVGWSLGGLSTITRCPQTLAEDNAVGTVQFDSNDRFCLDGQRLIAISGTYGDNGAEYRTARESFTRVISYGTAGSGPAWFEVRTKSGQILQYGKNANLSSRIEATGRSDVMVWAVDRIEDRVKNYLTVEYNEDTANGVYEPTVIRYTANDAAGLTDSQSVLFSYLPRPDTTVKYIAGSRMQRLRRLATIKTYDGTTLVKQYALAYDTGFITGRSRLTRVTECDAANRCYPPTVFNWQNGSFSTFTDGGAWATGKYANFNAFGPIRIGDPTGDGLSDVLLGPDSNDQWHMLRSTGSSFDDAVPGGLWANAPPVDMWCASNPNHVHAIDGTGNGLTDIIVAPTNPSGTVIQLTSTGTASNFYNLGNFTGLGDCLNAGFGPDPYFELDVDGDGRMDLVRNTLLVLRNTPLGMELPSWPVSGLPSGWDPELASGLDMNADGRGDLLFGPDSSGNWTVVKSTGSSFVGTPWGGDAQYANWSYGRRPLDVNGDGLPDMVLGPNTAGNWFVLLNTGTGFIDAGQ